MTDVRTLSHHLVAERRPASIAERGLSPAAALLLLYERDGEEHVLFQLRTQRVLHHRGEISLPGGAREAEDESLLATALRETEEEIGVSPSHVEVFGRLDEVATISSKYRIAPFVGAITRPGRYPFRCDEREVQELLEVPLAQLCREREASWSVSERDGEAVPERSFRYGEHLIWGVTARAVGQYLDLLAEVGVPPPGAGR